MPCSVHRMTTAWRHLWDAQHLAFRRRNPYVRKNTKIPYNLCNLRPWNVKQCLAFTSVSLIHKSSRVSASPFSVSRGGNYRAFSKGDIALIQTVSMCEGIRGRITRQWIYKHSDYAGIDSRTAYSNALSFRDLQGAPGSFRQLIPL
jgi:hypothetical protein